MQKHPLFSLLEPDVELWAADFAAPEGTSVIHLAVLASQAISLKRIADALPPTAAYNHTRASGHVWLGTSNEGLGFIGLGDLIIVRHADGGKIAEWFLGDAIDWSKPGRVLKATFDGWHPR